MTNKIKPDEPNTLIKRTRELLGERNLVDVHVATNIPFYWLRQLRSNEPLKGANVNRVQYLFEYLTGKPLFEKDA